MRLQVLKWNQEKVNICCDIRGEGYECTHTHTHPTGSLVPVVSLTVAVTMALVAVAVWLVQNMDLNS